MPVQPSNSESLGGVTVANFTDADLSVFRELSSAGEGDDFDLICDLHQDGDLIDDAVIRRQDFALIERRFAVARAALQQDKEDGR